MAEFTMHLNGVFVRADVTSESDATLIIVALADDDQPPCLLELSTLTQCQRTYLSLDEARDVHRALGMLIADVEQRTDRT